MQINISRSRNSLLYKVEAQRNNHHDSIDCQTMDTSKSSRPIPYYTQSVDPEQSRFQKSRLTWYHCCVTACW